MKKLVILLIVLIAINTQAQKSSKQVEKQTKKSFIKDLTPEEFSKLQTKRMTLQFDLTPSQQREIQKINLQNAKERKIKMEERKNRMKQLNGQKPTKEERLQMINERLDRQIAIKKQFKSILTEKQYEKWEKSMAQKMKNRAKRKGMKRKQMHN